MKVTYKRMKPYTVKWERLADELARDYAPQIYACVHCGFPVCDGYCCGNCKSNHPNSKK